MTQLITTITLTITTFTLSTSNPNQRYFDLEPNLTKIVTGINFRTKNYFNQSIDEIINQSLWEELLKLETMVDQKINPRELIQNTLVFDFTNCENVYCKLRQLIYTRTETFIIGRDKYSKWNNCITKYGRYFYTGAYYTHYRTEDSSIFDNFDNTF